MDISGWPTLGIHLRDIGEVDDIGPDQIVPSFQ
jgi:hypothetical protein